MTCGYEKRGRPAPVRNRTRTCLHAATSSRCLTSSGVSTTTPPLHLTSTPISLAATSPSPRTTAPVNQYARIARSYYAEHLPSRAATMTDADFAEMGETMANEIVDLAIQLEGPDQPGETYLAKVGRLNQAKMQATEIVLHNWLSETEPGTQDEASDTELADLWEAVRRLRDETPE